MPGVGPLRVERVATVRVAHRHKRELLEVTRSRASNEETNGAAAWVPTALKILIDDHRRISCRLSCFEMEVERFAQAQQPDYELLRANIDFCVEFLRNCHRPREELLLELLERRAPQVAAGYAGLIDQHAALVQKASRVASALEAIARDAQCSRDDLATHSREVVLAFERHIDWEEAHLFPAAITALLPSDWSELNTRLTAA